MSIPWYEYSLWFAVIIAKAILFYKCLNIRNLAFLQVFTWYGIIYECVSLTMFFNHSALYSQSIWILDFVSYFVSALLAVQLATIRESRNISLVSLMTLCAIMSVIILNVSFSNTENLLRIARFIDVSCIGLAFLAVVQKMDRLYRNLAIALGIRLSGDFLCNTIQAYDHWRHWAIVRPLFSLSCLIAVVSMIILVDASKDPLCVPVGELSLPAVGPIPARQHLPYP
jgi:hypothetical protein